MLKAGTQVKDILFNFYVKKITKMSITPAKEKVYTYQECLELFQCVQYKFGRYFKF